MFLSIFLALLSIVITIFSYCTFIPSYRTYKLVNKIHGPKGLPLIGIGWTFNRLKYFELLDYLTQQTIEFPRLTLLWLLGVPLVILTEPEDLAEILSSNVNIEKGVEYKAFIPWLNEGLLLSIDEKWHSRRKILTPTFHFRILEENLISMQKHAQRLVDKLLNMEGQRIDIHEMVTLFTLDVVCETAMGIELGAQNNQSKDYVNCVKRIGELIVFRSQNLYLHRDWLFGLTSKGAEFKKYLQQLHEFTMKIIKERKQCVIQDKINKSGEIASNGNSEQSKKKKAFLDLLLELDIENKLSDKDIREEVDTFLFEGHDTTSSAITFMMFALGLYPDIQAKCIEELDDILKNSKEPLTKQNLNDMKYLDCVIKEVLRMYPSVPYISRKIRKDVQLRDAFLPEGTNVVISPFILHRRPELFPDPEKFDPDRFTRENSSTRHPFAYIPFSAGPRNCIGQKFAMMEIKVVIASLLRSLNIETINDPKDIQFNPLLILRTEAPIFIKIKPRVTKH